MKYYVEINGESSLNIQGLAIQSLPPISKPLMRSKQETIDGRDGDVITKLGYAAYDKTLKIGLWGNYDINEIITFFNQEGEIVFSSEPDKYYRFTILNRDDYINKLEIFKTATIILHCQPYKYLLNEEPKEMENEYITETNVSSATFENTLEVPMNIDLKGNTLQNGTPTPSSPIPVNNVSGDNDIVICGKNLFDIKNTPIVNNTISTSGVTLTFNDDGTIVANGTTNGAYKNIKYEITLEAGTYYFSGCISGGSLQGYSTITDPQTTADYGNGGTFTINSKQTISFYPIRTGSQSNVVFNNLVFKPMIAKVPVSYNDYEAYNGTTYNIDLPVENLFDKSTISNDTWLLQNGTTEAHNDFCTSDYIRVDELQNYYLPKTNTRRFKYYNSSKQPLTNDWDIASASDDQVITIPANAYYVRITIQYNVVDINTYQFEKGTKKNSYTPYGTTPIELNKIGTYQDYFYKDSGKWYLHKETGKYTFTGEENFTLQNSNKRAHILNTNNQLGDILKTTGGTGILYGMYCNKLEEKTANQTWTGTQGISYDYNSGENREDIDISINGSTTIEQYKSAINGITMYFILNTPTNTEITYTPLIEQLESIKNAMSKEGTTNVGQVNNDAPFILDLSVLSGSDTMTITNQGNANAKPIINLTGSGNVGIYLNDIQVFQLSLGNNETIILDTENMEAYYGTELKNRQVIGDYNSFYLQSGDNIIRFTGSVSYIEITNYNRWI